MANGDGFKITLGINTSLIAASVVAVIGLYFQVQGMAQEVEKRSNLEIPKRVIILEQKITNIEKMVEDNQDKLDDIRDRQEDILEAVRDD
jgi:hypothetical protein